MESEKTRVQGNRVKCITNFETFMSIRRKVCLFGHVYINHRCFLSKQESNCVTMKRKQ